MSAEPIGTHTRGKPLPVESILRLQRLHRVLGKFKEACRVAGVSKNTGRKYLRPQAPLPELDI